MVSFTVFTAPCVPSDSDSCLQRSPLWGSSYTCNYFVRNPGECDSDEYEKDGRRCCPDACKNLERHYDPIPYLDPHIFTKADCNNSQSTGNCDYSPQIYDEGAQCRKPGKNKYQLSMKHLHYVLSVRG